MVESSSVFYRRDVRTGPLLKQTDDGGVIQYPLNFFMYRGDSRRCVNNVVMPSVVHIYVPRS